MLQLKQKGAGNRPQWLVEKRYTFGTDKDNQYIVSGDGVIEIHAGIEVDGDHVQLFNLGGSDCVKVNGTVLEKSQVLNAGDTFSVGDQSFDVEDPKLARKAKPLEQTKTEGWTLKAKNTALANKSFILEGTQIIGRSKDCDICLNVVHLSRKHAQISVRDKHLYIEDLDSSNGTFINNRRVKNAQVKSGDEIRFDTLKFSVFGPSASLQQTQVRQAAVENDATTMRPIFKSDAMAIKNKQVATEHKEKPKVTVQKPSTIAIDTPPTANTEVLTPERKTGVFWFIGGVAIVAAIAVYVLLG